MTHTKQSTFATDNGCGMIIKQWVRAGTRASPLCFTNNSHTFYPHLSDLLCTSLVCSLIACLFVNLNVDCVLLLLLGGQTGLGRLIWLLPIDCCQLPVACLPACRLAK